MSRVLSATKLHKAYAGREVVSGVSLEVQSGQVIGLLGPMEQEKQPVSTWL